MSEDGSYHSALQQTARDMLFQVLKPHVPTLNRSEDILLTVGKGETEEMALQIVRAHETIHGRDCTVSTNTSVMIGFAPGTVPESFYPKLSEALSVATSILAAPVKDGVRFSGSLHALAYMDTDSLKEALQDDLPPPEQKPRRRAR